MRTFVFSLTAGLALAAAAGCRTATRIKDVPRVDLQVEDSGGNRGYLVGTPLAAKEWKTTRQIVETDVELPSFYKTKPGRTSVEPMTDSTVVEAAVEEPAAPAGPYDIYIVQKGESLWTISKKPEIYGKATYWRRIFDANRDILKSPDKVRAGMKLKIPRGEDADGTTYSDQGTYQK